MATFTDTTGREWALEIPNFGTVQEVRKETGTDLNKLACDLGYLTEFIYDSAERVLDAAWSLVSRNQRGITKDVFLAAIDKPTLNEVRIAVVACAMEFCHFTRSAGLIERVRRAVLNEKPPADEAAPADTTAAA